MNVMSTDRLLINRITLDDAGFILKLMNDKDWIKNIGDRGIRTIEEAEEYIRTRFLKTYNEVGFGFYSLIIKETQQIIGIAGLVDREGIDHIDIGYGMLPEYRGKGYAQLVYAYLISVFDDTAISISMRRAKEKNKFFKDLGFTNFMGDIVFRNVLEFAAVV